MKIFIDILFNLGTMTTFGVISSLVGNNNQKPIRRPIFHGIIFGSGAVIGMLNPVVLRPGLIFDGRSVLISLAALIYGPLTGIISALMALTLRIFQGGVGVWMGCSVIVVSALVGVIFHYKSKAINFNYPILQLFTFGLLVHFLMIICTLALPRNIIVSTIKTIALPVMIIYPLATVVLGKILSLILSRSYLLETVQDIVDNAPFGAHRYELEPGGRLIFMGSNRAAETILGVNHQQFIGKTIEHAFPDLTKTDVPEAYKIVAATGKPYNVEQIQYNEGGISGAYEIHAFYTGTNRMTVFFRDISERKRAEKEIKELNEQLEERVKQRTQELEESNKALQSFSYCVSHDLRAPLRAIEGFSKIALDDYSDKLDSTGTHYLTIISQSVGRMNLLINGLLLISRVTNAEFKKSKINMKEMVESILSELKESNQLPLQIEIICDELMPIDGDPALIRQVLVNLLENSIKFSSANSKPQIKITSYPEGENVVFVVKDNGVGFNQNYAKHLFTVFQRLHSSTDYEGTGVKFGQRGSRDRELRFISRYLEVLN